MKPMIRLPLYKYPCLAVMGLVITLHLVILLITGCTTHSFGVSWDQGSLTFSSTNDTPVMNTGEK